MKIFRGERGAMLVELILATAVTGIIVGFLGTGIYQMINVTESGNQRLTALHELQNAAYWFNADGQKATGVQVTDDLQLTISPTETVTYSLDGRDLYRSSNTGQMTLAQNITRAEFSVDGNVVTMSLTSAPEGRDNVEESGTYTVTLRPTGGG